MNLAPSIFKAYDIRGVYPGELDDEGAYAIGRAYATLLLRELDEPLLRIAVGSDARLSSPSLKATLIKGITETGLNVLDIGFVSTPTFYFAVAAHRYHGGVQVSASHNPKEWNGFKIVRKGAVSMGLETGLQEIKRIIETNDFAALVSEEKKGLVSQVPSIVDTQILQQGSILMAKHPIRALKVVVDTGNGMGVTELRALFKRLPVLNIIWMNEALDGNFPGHPADPMNPDNTVALRERIVAEKADLGIATDGDGDRVFFFDEKGDAIPQEILRAIMAEIVLEEHPKAKIVYDTRPGKITPDIILEKGGKPVLAPVGSTLIKAVMVKEGAVYGGESSGHHFFAFDYGTFEAPTTLIVHFLQFVSRITQPVSVSIHPYRRYFNSGEINTALESRAAGLGLIEKLKSRFSNGVQNVIDGLSVTYPDYSFNVRLSNTEPLIRLIVESPKKEKMEEKKEEILGLIRGVTLPLVKCDARTVVSVSPFLQHWSEYVSYILLGAVAIGILLYEKLSVIR